MNASHTDSDPYALSTQVAADHSAYHVNIDVPHARDPVQARARGRHG